MASSGDCQPKAATAASFSIMERAVSVANFLSRKRPAFSSRSKVLIKSKSVGNTKPIIELSRELPLPDGVHGRTPPAFVGGNRAGKGGIFYLWQLLYFVAEGARFLDRLVTRNINNQHLLLVKAQAFVLHVLHLVIHHGGTHNHANRNSKLQHHQALAQSHPANRRRPAGL